MAENRISTDTVVFPIFEGCLASAYGRLRLASTERLRDLGSVLAVGFLVVLARHHAILAGAGGEHEASDGSAFRIG